MTQRDGVLVVGSISADVTVFSSRLPRPGETVLGDDFSLVLGGKGANQAVAAGRAGAPTVMVGCVGDDVFGQLVTTSLVDAAVDVAHVRRVPGPTGVAHIRVGADGENDIVVVPLANAHVSGEQIDAAFAALGARCAVLLTQLEIPWESALHALRRGRKLGLTVVLDPAPARPLPDEVWALVDIVTPNETEAALLTGIPIDGPADAERAGRWFVERGAGAALLTLGGAGAVLVTAESVTRFAPVPTEAVDTTAAGDAFAGHLAAALAAGASMAEAVLRAGGAGALAVRRRGASPSIPTAAEVDALLATPPAH